MFGTDRRPWESAGHQAPVVPGLYAGLDLPGTSTRDLVLSVATVLLVLVFLAAALGVR